MNNVKTLGSQITGNDYLSAYRSRMGINDGYFKEVAKELTDMGYKVYAPKDGLISWIRVESEDKHINFGFTDVPYRWYLSCDINYKLGRGSGKNLKEEYDYNTPFTALQIIANMQPNVPTIVKSTQYLKLIVL